MSLILSPAIDVAFNSLIMKQGNSHTCAESLSLFLCILVSTIYHSVAFTYKFMVRAFRPYLMLLLNDNTQSLICLSHLEQRRQESAWPRPGMIRPCLGQAYQAINLLGQRPNNFIGCAVSENVCAMQAQQLEILKKKEKKEKTLHSDFRVVLLASITLTLGNFLFVLHTRATHLLDP